MERADILILGAGLAGLSTARHLERAGRASVILDRAARPGGRLATRTVGEDLVDDGPVFGHGRSSAFLAAAQEASAEPLLRWPEVVRGSGPTCSPRALHAERFAFRQGMNHFAAQLAAGLDLRRSVQVTGLERAADGWIVRTNGPVFSARTVVVTFPAPQTSALIAPVAPALAALLGMVTVVPCLTLVAQLPLDAPDPGFDLCLPERSPAVQLIANDSQKRLAPRARTLVIQARAAWSAERLEVDASSWAAQLLDAARPLCPTLERASIVERPQRWRYARIVGPGLAAPTLAAFPGGAYLGLAGEAFDASAGMEGAWRSGLRLAQQIVDERIA